MGDEEKGIEKHLESLVKQNSDILERLEALELKSKPRGAGVREIPRMADFLQVVFQIQELKIIKVKSLCRIRQD